MLKEQMKNVREDLIKVEKNTVNDSMKLLLDLDIMRTNILNIQTGLQVWNIFFQSFIRITIKLNFKNLPWKEADNWTTLTSDLDSILETRDTTRVTYSSLP